MITARVAGVTFAPGYPRNLGDLARRCAIEGPVRLELVREHDNGHDLNAIAVHLESRPLGHVPAVLAAAIAPEMDFGIAWTAEAIYVAVDVEHRGRPGLEIELSSLDPASVVGLRDVDYVPDGVPWKEGS